jgi:murein L,D-transpeptidase YcbB/YkuD
MTFDPTKPAQNTTSTEGTSVKKSYNWDISFDTDGDFSWDNISTKLLQAMYANGKYDILDQMLDNGKITDTGLNAFYKTTLGQTGDKVRFDQNALQAALDGQYITQEQFNELSGLLPKTAPQTESATPAATPTVTPKTSVVRDDAYWLAQAKKYGFDSFDAVKKFQQENGLLVDGKVGD